jgi:hypothetical protein
MAGDEAVARWIANKLKDYSGFGPINSIGSGFLEIARKDNAPFVAAGIGVHDTVMREHLASLFELGGRQPEFVVNVPSKAIWSGTAIEFVHAAPAAFGKFGELIRASGEEPVWTYRNKEYSFFERAFRQHAAVREVARIYDRVYQLYRERGMPDIRVVLVDAYDMSAEHIRHARGLYGRFEAAVKTTSYGAITTAAREAAKSIGADAFMFGELMGRLNKP